MNQQVGGTFSFVSNQGTSAHDDGEARFLFFIANKWFLPVEVFDKGFKPPGLFATEFVKADKSKIATIFILIVLNSPL